MKAKKPVFSEPECEVAKVVIQRFVKNEEATTERFLMKELKSLRPQIAEAVRRLSGRSVFNSTSNTVGEELYTPKAVAYHYCGDADALAFAKRSTEIILSVVKNFYERELDTEGNAPSPNQTPFTREDAEAEARTIDPAVTLDMVRVGLALAEEFGVFRTIQRNEQQVGVVKFLPAKRIFELDRNAWNEHIRRCGVWLERDAEDRAPDQLVASFHPAWPIEIEQAEDKGNKVFVVHGRAEEPKQAVADFLRSMGLEAIILHEQPNQGRTIIEKFEKHSVVSFAVVLLTPDDFGGSVVHPEKTSRRARQNVILELGYFMGKLGRGKVCCLYVEGVELPSDYDGVLWVPYDDAGTWRLKLAQELSAAGIELDLGNTPIIAKPGNWKI
jgi:CAP12/Pycsar effector protein, TIR domain